MCLIFFALKQHPKYKLILAGNRDEFYNRRTAAADFWEDHPDILAGRDLEAMGTWLGISRQGRLSMLTNYRDPANISPAAPSRGKLVSDFLIGDENPESYMYRVSDNGANYNGFNLVVGNADDLWYYSNYGDGVKKISTGIWGLSNHLLDTPWPKVKRGKERFSHLVQQREINHETLFEFLYNDERASDDQLPSTGIPLERERALSSMFIKTPDYGSRCSTVILISNDNEVSFAERVYDLQTFDYSTQTFRFSF